MPGTGGNVQRDIASLALVCMATGITGTVKRLSMDRIKSWRPFRFRYESYDNTRHEITFTCPRCGGHNCEKIGDLDKDNFWSGHYRCTDCGETKENDNPICYYSDCFVNKVMNPDPVQLSLW